MNRPQYIEENFPNQAKDDLFLDQMILYANYLESRVKELEQKLWEKNPQLETNFCECEQNYGRNHLGRCCMCNEKIK
jgi:hypothetical protein